jgi:glutaconate CoA-transferase subunit A
MSGPGRVPVGTDKVLDLAGLVSLIADGHCLAVPSDVGGVSMAATRALLRRGIRDLHLVGVPTSGLQADLLIGAGCVRTVEASAVSLGEQGLAPRFTEAVRRGEITMLDATCPAVHSGLLAAQKGVPFMPMRGLIGSDLLRVRPDWQVIANPMAASADPIVLIPAIRPDVSLFHVPLADRLGNVWVGMRRELLVMAHASTMTLVSAERIVEDSLLEDPRLAPAVVPSMYISAVALAPRGSLPLALYGEHGPDEDALLTYAREARTREGFDRWLARFMDAGEDGA